MTVPYIFKIFIIIIYTSNVNSIHVQFKKKEISELPRSCVNLGKLLATIAGYLCAIVLIVLHGRQLDRLHQQYNGQVSLYLHTSTGHTMGLRQVILWAGNGPTEAIGSQGAKNKHRFLSRHSNPWELMDLKICFYSTSARLTAWFKTRVFSLRIAVIYLRNNDIWCNKIGPLVAR